MFYRVFLFSRFCGNLSSFIKKNYGLAANSLHGSEKVMSILCIYLFFVYICDNLYVDVTGLTRILSHPPVQMNEITNEQVVVSLYYKCRK